MNNQHVFRDNHEEYLFWLSFGYKDHEMVYCPLCKDMHKNSTNCLRND